MSRPLRVLALDPAGAVVPGVRLGVRKGRTAVGDATTDANGRAIFAGPPFEGMDFRADEGQGWIADGWVQRQASGVVELRLVRSASLKVRVVDQAGEVVRARHVNVSSRASGRSRSRPSDDGQYRFTDLLPGVVTIRVVIAGLDRDWLGGCDAWREATVAPGEDAAVEIAVRVPATGSIIARVRDSAGTPGSGIGLILQREGWPKHTMRMATTNDAGDARFGDLQPGVYVVGGPDGVRRVEVDRDLVELSVALVVPVQADLAVEVVDATGRPVPGAQVRAYQASGVADADGRATFRGVPKVRTTVSASAEGFDLGELVVRHDGAPVRIALTRLREVVVLGEAPRELEGARVLGEAWTGGRRVWRAARGATVRLGRFGLRANLPESTVGTLWLRVGEKAPVGVPFGPDDGQIDLGEVAFDDGVTLRGRLLDDRWGARGASASVGVTLASGGSIEGVVARDGRFVIRGVPAGPAVLHAAVRADHVNLRGELQLDVGDPTEADLGDIPLQSGS